MEAVQQVVMENGETVRVQAQLHIIRPTLGSTYITKTTWEEYHILRWMGSPSKNLPNMSNVFI